MNKRSITHSQIKKLVFNVLESLSKINPDYKFYRRLDANLLGPNSKLDSLGIVNLIVAIEQNIEDEFGVSVTIADERAMSQKHSPFRKIGTLVNYIDMLLKDI